MPNSLQSSAIASPASRRATNCSLSSITEHSFQGITPSPLRGKVSPMCPVQCVTYVSGRSSRLPNELRTAEVAKRPAEDLANQARYLDQLGRHGSQFIDEIRYRRGIRLPAPGTDGILPTTTPADQKSSMGAA